MNRVLKLSLMVLGAVMLLASCDTLLGFLGDDDGQPSIPPNRNLGRGYDIFGNFADARDVRAEVLSYDALDAAGIIDERTIETSTFQTYTGTTITDYSDSFASRVGVSGSYRAFSGSVETNFSSDTYGRAEYSFATVQSQIYKTQLSIDNPRVNELLSYLTPRAREDINNPSVSPRDLFRIYGTHVVQSIYIGGRLDYNMALDMSQITTSRSLSVMASASFDAVFVSAGIETETVSTEDRSFYESNAQRTLNVYGGASEFGQNIINDNDYQRWIESVSANPQFVGFPESGVLATNPLIAIWEFADDAARATALEEAFLALADETSIDLDDSLTVEVKLERIELVSSDDAGSNAELYGDLRFDGYNTASDFAFSGPRLWDISEGQADAQGQVSPGNAITVNRSSRHTFSDFSEAESYIVLIGHLYEDDNIGDDDMGFRTDAVYMNEGWNGKEHKLNFREGGTEANAVFTIRVIR